MRTRKPNASKPVKWFNAAIADAESKRSEVEKLENERRAKLEERVARQA